MACTGSHIFYSLEPMIFRILASCLHFPRVVQHTPTSYVEGPTGTSDFLIVHIQLDEKFRALHAHNPSIRRRPMNLTRLQNRILLGTYSRFERHQDSRGFPTIDIPVFGMHVRGPLGKLGATLRPPLRGEVLRHSGPRASGAGDFTVSRSGHSYWTLGVQGVRRNRLNSPVQNRRGSCPSPQKPISRIQSLKA